MSLSDFLGCRMESVTGVGKFPVLTGGSSVAAKAEGTAAGPAVAATVERERTPAPQGHGRFELTPSSTRARRKRMPVWQWT